MNSRTRDYIIVTILLIVIAAATYTVFTSKTGDHLDMYAKYASAPDCGGDLPKEPGICKYSTSTYLDCKYVESPDQHVSELNMLSCYEVNIYQK
jgi:hypothetical protein